MAHARSLISPDASQHFPPEQAELWHPSTWPQHPPGRLIQPGRPRTLAVHSSTDAVISCARWHPNSQLCRWNSGLLSFFSVLSGKLRLAMHAASAAAGGGVLGGVGGVLGDGGGVVQRWIAGQPTQYAEPFCEAGLLE